MYVYPRVINDIGECSTSTSVFINAMPDLRGKRSSYSVMLPIECEAETSHVHTSIAVRCQESCNHQLLGVAAL